jgi:hypothetical protein
MWEEGVSLLDDERAITDIINIWKMDKMGEPRP